MDILNLAVGVGVVVIIIGINNASTCARPQTAKLTIRAARSMFPNIWGGIRSCSDRPWRACGWDDLGDRPFFIGQWLLRTKMDAPRMESALPVTFWRFADGTTRQSPKAFPCVQEQYDALARSVEGFFVNPHESSYTVLKKALAGDNRAWDTLFSCLWPVAAGVAASVINGKGSKAMAEDIAQNVFVRLTENDSRRLRLFDPDKGMLEAYVAKIAHTSAIDYLRSNAKHFRNADIEAIPEPVHNSEPFPMVEEWELVAAMATLTPREHQVIDLLYRENLEHVDAAERLGVSQGTIRSEKSHGLKKLKKFFGQT